MTKRKYLIILGLIVIIVLFVFHFFFGIFYKYNYITAKIDLLRNRPSIIQYGSTPIVDKGNFAFPLFNCCKFKLINEKPSPAGNEAIKVAERFGFKYIIIENCTSSFPITNGLKYYNSVMRDYLYSVNGEYWEDKFNFAVDSLFKINRIDTIKQLILALPENKKLKTKYNQNKILVKIDDTESNFLFFKVVIELKNGLCAIISNYEVDPYTLEISKIQY
jgi:hypothetical protein